jgi:predicted RND superfamily exporter protein
MKKNDVKNDSRKDNNLMVKIATFIVDKRRAFYLIFALALVLCVISIPKVQVNNDISSYLPEETETRRGLTLMDDEFITYDTEKIMVTTITTETAEKLKDKLEKGLSLRMTMTTIKILLHCLQLRLACVTIWTENLKLSMI